MDEILLQITHDTGVHGQPLKAIPRFVMIIIIFIIIISSSSSSSGC